MEVNFDNARLATAKNILKVENSFKDLEDYFDMINIQDNGETLSLLKTLKENISLTKECIGVICICYNDNDVKSLDNELEEINFYD
jgi:hypothetical protein